MNPAHLETARAVLARTRSRLAVDLVEHVEQVEPGAYLLGFRDGSRMVVLDAWPATTKTTVSGPVYRHSGNGRVVGMPTRGRLDYDSTPSGHGDWRNVPDAAWSACTRFFESVEARPFHDHETESDR